jgi:hypothetical protein
MMKKEKITISKVLAIVITLAVLGLASAHETTSNGMKVRVTSYNPETHEYRIKCDIPADADTMRFYAIDPVPIGHEEFYRTRNNTFLWNLDPNNYMEQVHTKAMYHFYCEVQNYSAPAGQQNLASEFHVDLRTTHNRDVPNIYILSSFDHQVTAKCDPPEGFTNYNISWAWRDRSGRTNLDLLKNQRIVNISFPYVGAGIDVVCDVKNASGLTKSWDMPLELLSGKSAYVPTFEGCVPGEACAWVHQSGTPPNGTLIINYESGATVELHGKNIGTTSTTPMTINNIVPGIYNLVIKKNGAEISTLVSIRAGKTTTYPQNTFSSPGANTTTSTNSTTGTSQTCWQSTQLANIPATCEGGTITTDTISGCRTIMCESSSSRMKVMACNKELNGEKYFEIYKQEYVGSAIKKVCIGSTCLESNWGYTKSPNYPICTQTTSQTNNQILATPQWIEPSEGKSDVDPTDFHIHVFPPQTPPTHIATDFEIWDTQANQRIWSSIYEQQTTTHIHNADGNFEGSLIGRTKLENDRQYRVRARFYYQVSGNNVSEWSAWRNFRTKPVEVFQPSSGDWTVREGYRVEKIASDVSVPVNVVAAPKIYTHLAESERPQVYITQLYGKVGMIKNNGQYVNYASNLLNYESFGSLPGSGETGVTGLYVDPPSGDLFVSFVYYDGNTLKGRVERFITNNNGDGFTSRQTILSNIPVAASHQVQSITRGPDGKLYLNTGDADNPSGAKNNALLSGKILRFNDDGSIPSDNPISGSYVWASGFRNPFGAAWRPSTNELYVTENGPDSDDGVHKVLRGEVKGWCCQTQAGIWHHWQQTRAPVQLAFDPQNAGLPSETDNTLFVALSGSTYTQGESSLAKRIVQIRINSDGTKQESEFLRYTGDGYSSIIGLAFGDDELYFTDLYGELGFVGVGETRGDIYRIVKGTANGTTSSTNTTFEAFIAPKRWYPQGLEMVWECKAQGGSGNYRYSYYPGDGKNQLNTDRTDVYHKYSQNGTYDAYCIVHDQSNGRNAISESTRLVLGSNSGTTQNTSGGSNTPNTNTTNQTSSGSYNTNLKVAPWYPKGTHVVFQCTASGGSGNYEYSYNFGDGTTQITRNTDVYHIYPASQTYTTTCTSKDLTSSATQTRSITVNLATGTTTTQESTTTQPTNPTPTGIQGLGYTLTISNPQNTNYQVSSDSLTPGPCRVISFDTSAGGLVIKACDKDSDGRGIEIYKESASSALIDFEACFTRDSQRACVDELRGYNQLA